jgi:hypothetical protein
MSWGLVAVAGATVVTGAMSSKSASSAASSASDASAAQLAFAQQQYADWQETYGPLQNRLASYYSTVTPESYAATGLEAFQSEQQATQERLKQTLVQRGIDPDSGIAMSLDAQSELNAAESRASIRKTAESQYVQDQTNFLSVGMGNSSASLVSNALSSDAATKASIANSASQSAGNAWASAIPALGNAISAGTNYYKTTTANTGQVDDR